MVDGFGRHINYVRMSVTDRCDFRCRYCMSEHMTFLPRKNLLTLDEIVDLAAMFVSRGVKRIRLTGGEPLVRKNIELVFEQVGMMIGPGADQLTELTMTTNGSQLERFAMPMAAAGIKRINVSMDTRDPDTFRHLTRGGDLAQVLRGIDAAEAAGIAVKINMVGLVGINDQEIGDMLQWCASNGRDLTLIETMPLGEVAEDRIEYYLPLDGVRRDLVQRFGLTESGHRTGGPARYMAVPDYGTMIGFITPMSKNFCAGCNRIRVAATGTVFGCLGHDQRVELRDAMREGGPEHTSALLDRLLAGKPLRHEFDIHAARPAVARHMSVTGG
ncbi:GTP 3',8-cyclase MoaA [Aurantiacibacter sediminis]|uniref:GTP 3',8-cyclase n=1 Tax=Aurantiacibacter sediminis TaxID=2793064 RepID=A0ABS0N6S5_9SPHN|nr:GTP 3',8-cyclase MoaA [Aurantiacibacter sediminis]MBH5323461.1 GTP 3',8-cyclase MoaA [Aurantiacibacter sediminis]